MNDFLNEERFSFLSRANKGFILAFNDEMNGLGYDFGGQIGSGYCWGKYMLIYRKTGVKSKQVYARIYLRDESIVLRLFLNAIDKHREYIEKSPAYIKEVFTGKAARCKHDHDDEAGNCRFRKTYTLDDRVIEKCNGITFEFHAPTVQKLPDYISLFTQFYPRRRRGRDRSSNLPGM